MNDIKFHSADWKALSHAVRSLYQMKELLLTGKFNFPLTKKENVLAIKLGNVDFDEVSNTIYTALEEVEALLDKAKNGEKLAGIGQHDTHAVNQFILSFYK